jgi:hypothetical protein
MSDEIPNIGKRSIPQMVDSIRFAIRMMDGSASKPRPNEATEHRLRLEACEDLLRRIDPSKFREPY